MAQRKTKSDKSSYTPKYKEFITLTEFNRRKTIYNEYYTRCRDTKAYARFCAIREAFMRGDKNMVQALAEEARQALADGVKEVATPPFPDPEGQRRLHYLGIEEWDKTIVDSAVNIFSEPF
jgi:hypothetical protein